MDLIHTLMIFQLLIVGVIVGITIITSFEVPVFERRPMEWLWDNRASSMIFYYILSVMLIVVSIMMFLTPAFTKLEPPLNQPGLFIYGTSILLLSNFFTVPKPLIFRPFDAHPLIFHTAVFFLSLALLTASTNAFKKMRLERTGDLPFGF